MWKSLAIIGGVEAALEQVQLDLSKKIVIYRLQINVPHPLHLSHTTPYHTIPCNTIPHHSFKSMFRTHYTFHTMTPNSASNNIPSYTMQYYTIQHHGNTTSYNTIPTQYQTISKHVFKSTAPTTLAPPRGRHCSMEK